MPIFFLKTDIIKFMLLGARLCGNHLNNAGLRSVLCCAKLLQSYPTLCDPMVVACLAPLPVGFSRQ